MTGGWAITVTMERLGGGQPFQETWYAAIADKDAAIAAVEKVAQQTTDVKVTAHQQLSESAIAGVGLKSGEVGRWA